MASGEIEINHHQATKYNKLTPEDKEKFSEFNPDDAIKFLNLKVRTKNQDNSEKLNFEQDQPYNYKKRSFSKFREEEERGKEEVKIEDEPIRRKIHFEYEVDQVDQQLKLFYEQFKDTKQFNIISQSDLKTNFEVKESEYLKEIAGDKGKNKLNNGLYAKASIKKDTLLPYLGDILSWETICKTYGLDDKDTITFGNMHYNIDTTNDYNMKKTNESETVVVPNANTLLKSFKCEIPPVHFINHKQNQKETHAKIHYEKINGEMRPCIVFTKDVKAGEEIFINYGRYFTKYLKSNPENEKEFATILDLEGITKIIGTQYLPYKIIDDSDILIKKEEMDIENDKSNSFPQHKEESDSKMKSKTPSKIPINTTSSKLNPYNLRSKII